MNNSYSVIRSIRGPITLITLGLLFVMHNFTRYRFDQTWPVLLIVFGLLSLMQRGAAPPPPPPPPRGPFNTVNYPPPPNPASYSQSPYAQGPAKGGFGATAPKPADYGASTPEAPTSGPSTPEGGSV